MSGYKACYERGIRVGIAVAEAQDRGEYVSELTHSDEYSDRAHRGALSEKSDEFLQEHFLMKGYEFGKQLHNQSKNNFRSVFDSIYD